MARIFALSILVFYSLSAYAIVNLREIRTASKNVLVLFFTSTSSEDDVNTTLSQWRVNGQEVLAINRYVMQADAADHHIYLTVPQLENGITYNISTPHGDTSIVFDDHKIFCESIKTNQSAYSALATNNYALFAIWLGTGGSQQINGSLPGYEVFEQYTGNVVVTGTLEEIGADESSGDHVYRIDLAEVPEGGPYKIAIEGYGCSYPFGVGGDFSKRLAYVIMRGQYYQRCGCPIHDPYGWDIRMNPCHTTIYDVDGPIGEANIDVTGSEPTMTVIGGYHDAGDTDRRAYHIPNSIINLCIYEAFPDLFLDDQYNIPDKFDESYNIVGKGNGVPDIIDEAEWGALVWEYLQNEDGSIHFGTETRGYSTGAPYDTKDTKLYGTVQTDARAAAVGAGMFMHLARILKPYKPERSTELKERAERSFNFIGSKMANSEKLYYHIQRYLLTGDESDHNTIRELQGAADNYATVEREVPYGYSLNNSYMDNPGYFFSYIVQTERPTDSAVVERFSSVIKIAADRDIGVLNQYAYPIGNRPEHWGWGHNVRQPQYACASILHWRLSGEQDYLNAAASLMNYILGMNPIGVSYVTGLGFHQVHNPHDRQSWYTKLEEWGRPTPGITVFGPGVSPEGRTVPDIKSLPIERQWCDNQSAISLNEFTIFETMTHNALYTVLAKGGSWDENNDPFTKQQVAILPKAKTVVFTGHLQPTISLQNNTLSISFTLTKSERVRGALYELNGRTIMAFDFGNLSSGEHRYSFPSPKQRNTAGIMICSIKGQKMEYSKVLYSKSKF